MRIGVTPGRTADNGRVSELIQLGLLDQRVDDARVAQSLGPPKSSRGMPKKFSPLLRYSTFDGVFDQMGSAMNHSVLHRLLVPLVVSLVCSAFSP